VKANRANKDIADPMFPTYLMLLGMAALWGGTFIAGRLIGISVDPYSAAFLRFAIASACLWLLTLSNERRIPRLDARQSVSVILLGLTGVFAYNVFFFRGLETVDAGQAAAVIAMNPAVIALLSMILFGERGGILRMFGIGLSLIGALIVISNGRPLGLLEGGLGAGRLDIVMCVFSWVAYSLVGKRVLVGLSPLVSVTYASTIGMLMLAWPVWAQGTAAHWTDYGLLEWSSLLYLGLGGTVIGFVWYYKGIQRIGAMRASVFINFVPVSAILLGHLVLDETVGWPLALGAMLVIGGVYLTNRPDVAGCKTLKTG
jgi:drug/metabolite transporter (DMT)-like permease